MAAVALARPGLGLGAAVSDLLDMGEISRADMLWVLWRGVLVLLMQGGCFSVECFLA